jgi:hypothetical protein
MPAARKTQRKLQIVGVRKSILSPDYMIGKTYLKCSGKRDITKILQVTWHKYNLREASRIQL